MFKLKLNDLRLFEDCWKRCGDGQVSIKFLDLEESPTPSTAGEDKWNPLSRSNNKVIRRPSLM